jgi:pimeloyl-ACP methyl ester carboxylesterase
MIIYNDDMHTCRRVYTGLWNPRRRRRRNGGTGVSDAPVRADPTTVLGSPAFARTDRGNRVRYFDANPAEHVAVVLVHGGGANVGWWLRVAPTLAERFRVLTVELSGHGDSDHCPGYSPEAWAQDVTTVLDDASVDACHVVGHSMGGRVATYVAATDARTASLTLLDSPFHQPGQGRPHGRVRNVPKKLYPTAQEAVSAFKLRPAGSSADPELIRMVASCSIVETPSGWTWKFDPSASQRFTDEGLHRQLQRVRCPVLYVRAEHSAVTDVDTARYLRSVVGDVESQELTGVHHHISLDAPARCSALIAGFVEKIEERTAAPGGGLEDRGLGGAMPQ